MSRRVLVIATTTGYQIRAFGEAAERLGVHLVFASDRCDQLDDPWWDQAVPVRFHDAEASTRALVEAFRATPPDGIVAVGDRPAILAACAAQAFGLPGNPPAAARASRNKRATRDALRAAGLPTPEYQVVSLDAAPADVAARLRYPVVLKPLALSGSRGVMRVDKAGDFVAAFKRLRRLLASADVRVERDGVHTLALVESFVPGREYAVEGVLTRGVFQPFAIFDKPDPLDGPFFEETIYVTPSRAPAAVQDAIVDAVARAARALGLVYGPVHAECRVNDHGVYVLEVAARPIGGLCARALRLHDGAGERSLEEALLCHALGEDVRPWRRAAGASGVMMIPIPRRGVLRGVEGIDDARRVAGIEDVRITAKRDALLVPLPEGHSYLGFIFARGGEPGSVESALRAAHACLRFTIERELPLASGA
jgi:biotin carboxylase